LKSLQEFVYTFGYKMDLANTKKVAESLNKLLMMSKEKAKKI
jgi:ribonuclease R